MSGSWLDEIRNQNAERFYEIWDKRRKGIELYGEDKQIGELMSSHKEYYHVWNNPRKYMHHYFREDEVNPFFHIIVDQIALVWTPLQ